MLKQSELNAEEQAAAFRRADELFRADSEQSRNAKAASDAAEELGIPQEYLDRAAAQIHAEKVERIKAQRNRRNLAIAIGAGVIAIGLGVTMLRSPQQPLSVRAAQEAQFAQRITSPTVDLTREDLATTVFRGAASESSTSHDAYTLKILKFTPIGNGNYQANHGFALDGGSLAGYKQVSFSIKGDGIANTRVDLRSGNTRWNSNQIALNPQGERITVRFNELRQQTKQGDQWVSARGEGPQKAQSLVFKFGNEINPVDTKGTVTISDIRFE